MRKKNIQGFVMLAVLTGFACVARAASVTDDFNRAELGANWTVTSGSWAINGAGDAAAASVNNSRAYLNTLETLNTDGNNFTLTADIKLPNTSTSGKYGGLMFNFQDDLNYYVLRFCTTSAGVTSVQMLKIVNGSSSTGGGVNLSGNLTAPGIAGLTFYTVSISSSSAGVFDYSIESLDGNTTYISGTATDTGTVYTGGYSGLYEVGGSTVTIDNYSLETTAPAVGIPIRFANNFTNGCVLQRDQAVTVFGTCEPDETITLEINEQLKTTAADSNGNWQVELDPEPAGGPFTMTVSGSNSSPVTLTDIYFGDVSAEPVRLANIFASGCVLQRDRTLAVWGTCEPGETITLKIKDQLKTTVADSNGNWRIELDPEPAGGPFAMNVSDSINPPVVLTDVYFGDVWILTGQSNMYQPLDAQVSTFPNDYPSVPDANDNFDDMRLAIIKPVSNSVTEADVTMSLSWSRWQADKLSDMSAVGYFFARFLNENLDANGLENVPLGFVKVCKGSTSIIRWISAEKLASAGLSGRDSSIWYNGMIAPIQDYQIKGVLWYQGEGDTDSLNTTTNYLTLKQALVDSWREEWNNPDMPFYFVQLAPYYLHSTLMNDKETDFWPWMREIQTKCLAITNTAMACIIDSGLQNNIHPPFKDRVGERLARIALAETYGLPVVCRGPTVQNVQFSGSDVIITFDHVAAGLRTQAVDSQPDADEIATNLPPVSISADELGGFALCGPDQEGTNVFYWATRAEIISSNQVRISNAADVPVPTAVRYAWQNYPRCNLFNSEGLPAEPFRTDANAYGTSSGADSTPRAEGISDKAAPMGQNTLEVDISQAFIDIEDRDALSFSVTGVSDQNVVSGVSISNQTLIITFSGAAGESTVTVAAQDSAGNIAETVFTVTVETAYGTWRHGYFTPDELNDPSAEASVWGDLADPDRDGRPNLLEYALALNPVDPDQSPRPVSIVLEGGLIKARFLRSKQASADSSVSVGLQKASGLKAGSEWLGVTAADTLHQDLGDTEMREVVLSSAGNGESVLFIRLYAERLEN